MQLRKPEIDNLGKFLEKNNDKTAIIAYVLVEWSCGQTTGKHMAFLLNKSIKVRILIWLNNVPTWLIKKKKLLCNPTLTFVCCDQSCPTLCDPMDFSPPVSSVCGIYQARILEQFAMSYSRGFPWPGGPTCLSWVSCIGKQIPYQCTTWKPMLTFSITKSSIFAQVSPFVVEGKGSMGFVS